MEVKFKRGDRLPLPEGCKAVIEGNVILIQSKGEEFKDGDIVVPAKGNCIYPFIYRGASDDGTHKFYAGIDILGDLVIDRIGDCGFGDSELRLATEEEQKLLFMKMKEQGLRWNAEEKKVEEIKWQPQNGERYFFVNAFCGVSNIVCFENHIDEGLEKIYNQFRTEELAEKAAEAVRETLRRFREENKIE